MANLPETPQWEEGIYQIEVSDPVLGGPDGISNRQAKQLAKRTSYLKQVVEDESSKFDKHITDADPHTQYAQKDSPTLTGTPKAPTAPAVSNTTQIANTAFVQALITALIGGAPTGLNTLSKIALSLNNDPIFAANVNAALQTKAPLASPQFSGVPAAPTPDVGLNNNQIATTAFVKAALAALVNSAPGALDTLQELAAALGNDPNFATTITNALALKAPLNSPALAGTPTAPTAPAGTNNGQLATTAFITAALTALLPRRSFGLSDFIRIPDVPGGLILQWGTTAGADANGLAQAALPTPFPGNGLCAVCAYYNGSRNAIATQVASITPTAVQFFASGVSGAAAQGAPVRYFVVGY